MFKGVNEKLERACYFLDNLKTLAKDAGGIARIKEDKRQEMRANLDGFFFEIISAKDFFLQGINDRYGVGLPKTEATLIGKLKQNLSEENALKVVNKIERLLAKKNSWLERLNNYRHSATHRELMPLYYDVKLTVAVRKIAPREPRLDITSMNVKVHLLKDPEDPSQGYSDIEVIPYCEQSLDRMRKFLDELYLALNI